MRISTLSGDKKRHKIIIAVIALAILLGGLIIASYVNSWGPFQKNNTTPVKSPTTSTSPSSDNATDPTYNSEKSNNPTKSEPGANNNSRTNSKSSAEVAITSASVQGDSLEIRAFASNVIEGGTCKATAKNGSKTVSATSNAFIDATTSPCEPIEIPLSKLSAGSWSITVAYESKNYAGVSAPTEVKI